MKKQVLLAANISENFRKHLAAKGYELVEWNGEEIDKSTVGIITSNKLELDSDTLKPLSKLRWIARLGSGVEIIDTIYCKENNIAFASSPAGIANSVAEHCIALLISLQKNIASSYQEIQHLDWIREPNRGVELEGQTIGIIGYGNTGQALAKKLSVFGVKAIAYDKYKSNFADEYTDEYSLKELQASADIISFHVPLNNETHHYYNRDFIASCKKHILMNTSRGPIVHTADLLYALDNKLVIGAALDVLEGENELKDKTSEKWLSVKELMTHNVILTPHIAGYSYNAIEKMSAELMHKLAAAI